MTRALKITFIILVNILLLTLIAGAAVQVYTMIKDAGSAPVVPVPDSQPVQPYSPHPGLWAPRFGFFGFLPCLAFLGILSLVFFACRMFRPHRWHHWGKGPGYWRWHADQAPEGTGTPPPSSDG